MEPTTIAELCDYLRAHPWLVERHGIGAPFKAVVDRGRGCIWKGATATYITLIDNPMCDSVEVTFDATGFTVTTNITTAVRTVHRYEYTLEPTEVGAVLPQHKEPHTW